MRNALTLTQQEVGKQLQRNRSYIHVWLYEQEDTGDTKSRVNMDAPKGVGVEVDGK